MEQQILDRNTRLIRFFQYRHIICYPVGQSEFSLIIKLHHCQQRSRDFRQRGQVIQAIFLDRFLTLIGITAETLVVDRKPFPQNHYMASWISLQPDTFFCNAVYLRQYRSVHPHILRTILTRSFGGDSQSIPRLKQSRQRNRQTSVGIRIV